MKTWIKRLLAWHRVLWGHCPKCNGDAPAAHSCRVCSGRRIPFPPSWHLRMQWLGVFEQTVLRRYPTTVREAVEHIVAGMRDEDVEYVLKNDSSSVHHTAGRATRNSWSLWDKTSPIVLDAIKTYGIAHGDDISGLIYEWVWAEVRCEPFDPQKAVLRYKDHWAARGLTPLQAAGIE